MEFFSELLAGAANNPLIKFLVGVLGFGIFVRIVMLGFRKAVLEKMDKGRKRKLTGRIMSHALGPVLAVILFGNEIFTMGPRRGAWGYIGAAAMGWAGSIGAIAVHHWQKNRAKRKASGKIPK